MRLRSPIPGTLAVTPLFAFLALLPALCALLTACTSCRVAQSPASTPLSATADTHSAPPPSPSPRVSLVCPTQGSFLVQEPFPANAGHRVILSWKASARPNSKHGAAFGYCVYRGKGDHDLFPQLLNSIPFSGTRCMDDWVENTNRYTYVVRAISATRVISDPSNVVRVAIPSGGQSKPSGASAPLCRQPTAVK